MYNTCLICVHRLKPPLCVVLSLPLPSSSVRQLLHLPPPAVDNPASSFDAHLLPIRVLGAYILPDYIVLSALDRLACVAKMILVKFGYSDLVESFLYSVHGYEIGN